MNKREIKFRWWSLIGGEPAMVYSDRVADFASNDLRTIPGQWHVMQYTGLKDKNGREIYEGDILRHRSGIWIPLDGGMKDTELCERSCVGSIIYEEGSFWFLEPDGNSMSGHWEEELLGEGEYWTFEVIGNVHKNPELLNP